jgi:LEA14-like dessication related protein
MGKYVLLLSVLSLLITCKSPPPLLESEPGPSVPPAVTEIVPQRIAEPKLTITSITILQADLINTRLKLTLKIDNPNTFPLTLSTFRYELYGNGAFWAKGMRKNLAVIPAEGSSVADVNLDMNFIDMKRQLLDDIVAMREVHYRIVGGVDLDAPEIPGFRINFDYSGNSPVKY